MLRSLSQKLSNQTLGREKFLPTTSADNSSHRRRNQAWWALSCNKKSLRLVVTIVVALAIVHILWSSGDRKPPLYEKYFEEEVQLPQHNIDLPYPEGRYGQYIWYANHVHSSGWGNAMQEHLLNAHLAHESDRAFVFGNYTWKNPDDSAYTNHDGHLIPAHMPISALIRGPAAGGAWPPGDLAPRAVIKEHWDKVCRERDVILSEDMFKIDAEVDAGVVLDTWVEKLKTMSRCVEISELSAQIWSIWMFGGRRILGVWNSLKKSPVITQFRWSQLVEDGYLANRHLFSGISWLGGLLDSPSAHPYTTIPGLLAIHVRRGDFEKHCEHFARWQSQWNGFNQFPELPDQFRPPPPAGWGEYTEEGKEIYIKHCYPNITQIVERVAEVRATPAGEGLKYLYVMTNGKREWVAELQKELSKMGGWKKLASSKDLKLNWEQKYVAQAIDMLIGQRAQVVIGNGFSSLTSNIVMLRMAQDIPPDTNRMW